ncbi:MAG: beta-galactosidase [Lachnospiraceae bacterium]|nr:beta-galactosidase [Lachnospiraceae bacterium]
MKELLYGAAYYPEYEPEYRTDQDLSMMKAAGMNVIRIAESTWSTWEPREGIYDFSILENTLEEADKHEMQVIVGTPTYAVPAWLVKKDPDVLATTIEGRGLYGRRQIMDIMNPTYRKAAEDLIRHMMPVVEKYDCVIGFQLDNETKHYGTAGANVQKLFVEHLKEKFGTVEAMNQAFGLAYWSNSIGSWDDMPDVRGTINGSLACEFERFQRKLASNFLLWQRAIIDEYRKPHQFVTHNLDFEWKQDAKAPGGHSWGVQPGINHLEASEALTIAGVDIYHPTQDDLTGMEIAFGGDSTRSLKNAPYICLETEAQAFRYWTPFPGQLMLQAMSHLASGAKGVEYWHWHSIHNSFETYWKGVLSHDMQENRIYRECAEIGSAMKRLSPYLTGVHKENQVALLVDNDSLTALKYFPIGDAPDQPGAETLSYNDLVMAYYQALYEQNIECDVLDVHALPGNIDRYRVLVTPALYCASDETIRLLRNFVDQGGSLVSSFKSFFTDENVKVRADFQPYGMTDVFGLYYQEFTRPGSTRLKGLPVTIWQELLIPEDSDRVKAVYYDHPYWGKYAGIVRKHFGKGYGYYIGCNCDQDILEETLLNACEKAGVDLIPDIDARHEEEETLDFPLILRTVQNDRGQKIHFLMNYSQRTFKVRCPYIKARNLLDDRTYEKNAPIDLCDWDVMVLLEE